MNPFVFYNEELLSGRTCYLIISVHIFNLLFTNFTSDMCLATVSKQLFSVSQTI